MISRGTRRYLMQRARRVVARILAPPARRSLTALALIHGTDKWGRHRYTTRYEEHLARFRMSPVRLLEIGVGGHGAKRLGGASLRMWKSYFPKGQIFGFDIHDKSSLEEPRISILRGDQADRGTLDRIGAEHGPFDIVIDDGSHQNEHVISSFETLFPHVGIGGIYVVEDTQTSYWPRFGGDESDLNSTHTTMGYMKALVDGLNWAERSTTSGDTPFAREIVGIHFYHNLVFVERGVNDEPGGDPQASM